MARYPSGESVPFTSGSRAFHPPMALRHAAPGEWSRRRCGETRRAIKRPRLSATLCNVAAETRPQACGPRRSLAMARNASQTI